MLSKEENKRREQSMLYQEEQNKNKTRTVKRLVSTFIVSVESEPLVEAMRLPRAALQVQGVRDEGLDTLPHWLPHVWMSRQRIRAETE
jgi:hypothetical protein